MVTFEIATKKCRGCGKVLGLDNFYKSHLGYYQGGCKRCTITRSNLYKKNNPDKRTAWNKAWRDRHKNTPTVKAQHILDNMRKRTRKKGLPEPEFTTQEIKEILANGRCCKTGIPFEFSQDRFTRSPWTPSPDRINPSIGYTKDNVQWVCHMYNTLKQEFTEVEVKKFLVEYYRFNRGDF